jgi:hypothetical protein
MESKEFIQAAFYLKMQKLDGTSQRVGPASLSRYNSLFNGIVEQLDGQAAASIGDAGPAAGVRRRPEQLQLRFAPRHAAVSLSGRLAIVMRQLPDSAFQSLRVLLSEPEMIRMQEASEAAFPRILRQGPVLDYFCRNAAFPAGIGIQVEQLAPLAEARKSPEQACICWTTRDESGAAFALQTEAPAGT